MVSFTLKRKYKSNTAIHGYRSSVHKQMEMPVLLCLVFGSWFRSLLRSKRALVPSSCFTYAIPLEKQSLQMNTGCQKCDKFKQTSSHNYQRICIQRRKGNYAPWKRKKKKKKAQTSYMKTRQRELLLKWVLPVPKTFDSLFPLRL